MNSYAKKTQEGPRQLTEAAGLQGTQESSNGPFMDARPEALQMRKLQAVVNNSARAMQLMAIQEKIVGHATSAHQGKSPEKSNNTGLPAQLKSGIESLSGMAMDHVRVHYNSAKPAQLQAHAYAQGSDIHIGPSQEKHLPHEAWHVVQQAQGRVKPTVQMKGNALVNDDAGLEHEADVMGSKALDVGKSESAAPPPAGSSPAASPVAQLLTYAMRYPGEKDPSYADIVKDATTISGKEEGGAPLIQQGAAWTATTAKLQKNVHIVGHGNVESVGGFDPAGLIEHMKGIGLNLNYCEKIKLHSCDSAVVDTRKGYDESTIYVNRMATLMPPDSKTKIVGMTGHSFTDSNGDSRVIEDPSLEEEYKAARDRLLKRGESAQSVDDEYLMSVADSEQQGERTKPKPPKDAYSDPNITPESKALIEEGLATGTYPPRR